MIFWKITGMTEADITIHKKELLIGNFCFRHETKSTEPFENADAAGLYIFRHVHPGITHKRKRKTIIAVSLFLFFTKIIVFFRLSAGLQEPIK